MERRRLLICTTLIFGLAACGGGESDGGDNGGGGDGSATDGPEIIVSGDLSTTLNESSRDGSAITSRELQVKLSAAPAAAVQVSIKASVADKLKFEPASFTLSDTDPKTVKVTVLADEDTTDDELTIRAEASGYGSYEAKVKIVDKTITIAAIADLSLSTGSVDFSVEPSAPGTITVTRPDTDAGNSILLQDETDRVVTLSFEDTDAQDVTVQDAPSPFGTSGQIPLIVAGAYLFPVTVTVDYTAAQAILVYKNATGGEPLTSIEIREGVHHFFSVQLATAPSGDVTIAYSIKDADLLTASGTLAFNANNWSTRQTLHLFAFSDDGNLTDDKTTITLTASTGESKTYEVTITDRKFALALNIPDRPASYATDSLPLQEGGPGQQICFQASASPTPMNWTVRLNAPSGTPVEFQPVSLQYSDESWKGCGTVRASDEKSANTANETVEDLRFELVSDYTSFAHAILPEIAIQDDEADLVHTTLFNADNTSFNASPSGELAYNPVNEEFGMVAVSSDPFVQWYSFGLDGDVGTPQDLYDGPDVAPSVHDGALVAYASSGAFYHVYIDSTRANPFQLRTAAFSSTGSHPAVTASSAAFAEDGAQLRYTDQPSLRHWLSFSKSGSNAQVSGAISVEAPQLVKTAPRSYTALWITSSGTPYCRQVTLDNDGVPQPTGSAPVNIETGLASGIIEFSASAASNGRAAVVFKKAAGDRYTFVELDGCTPDTDTLKDVGEADRPAPKLYFNGVEHRLLTETPSTFGNLYVYDMDSETPSWYAASSKEGAMVWAQDRWVLRRLQFGKKAELKITTGAF